MKKAITNWLLVALLFIGATMNAQIDTVRFSVSQDTVCPNQRVYETNTSVPVDPTNVKYIWSTDAWSSTNYWEGPTLPQGILFQNNVSNTYHIKLQMFDTLDNFIGQSEVSIHLWPPASYVTLSSSNYSIECNNSVTVSATGETSYLWLNSTNDTISTGTSVNITVPGSYNVFGISQFGCISQNSANFWVNNQSINAAIYANWIDETGMWQNGTPDTIKTCSSSVDLNGNVFGSFSGPPVMTWENNSTNQNRTVSVSGMYKITVLAQSGCIVTDSVYVILLPHPAPVITSNGAAIDFCEGGSVILTTTQNYYEYIWNNWSFDSTLSVNSSMVVDVTVRDAANGCRGTSPQITVNVRPAPAIPIVTPINCELQSSEGSLPVTWVVDTSTAIMGTTQLFTPSHTGIYVNIVTNPMSGCTASSLPYAYTMPASPVILVSDTTICNGAVAHLSVFNPTAFSGLVWSNGVIGPFNDVTVAGTYGVVGSQGNCSLPSSGRTITVNPVPTGAITPSNTSFCSGGSVVLSLPSGLSYDWSTGQNSQSINVFSGGYYSATITNNFNCSSILPSIQIIENANPPEPTITGPCILSTNSGFSYQWYSVDSTLTNVMISGATGQYLSIPHVPNYYLVKITDANGCTNTSDPYWSDCGTGINEETNTITSIYPNPVVDDLTIQFSDNEEHVIRMFDMLGKEVINMKGHNSMTIETSNLNSGIYFIPNFGKIIKK